MILHITMPFGSFFINHKTYQFSWVCSGSSGRRTGLSPTTGISPFKVITPELLIRMSLIAEIVNVAASELSVTQPIPQIRKQEGTVKRNLLEQS
jgi:hypothetical protein